MAKHVIVNPNTSVGLAELAEEEGADAIVFGSEYRTAQGLVKPGISAHKLLLGGPAAIAVAPAGYSNPFGQRQHGRHHRPKAMRRPADGGEPRRRPRRLGGRVRRRSRRPARGRLAARVAAGEGHPERLQRLCGRGRELPRDRRFRAESRSTSVPLRGAGRAPSDEDDRRDPRVAAVDRLLSGSQLERARLATAGERREGLLDRAAVDGDRGGRRRGVALGLRQDLVA